MATKTNTTINGKEYYVLKRTIGHELVDGKKKPIYKYFYGSGKTNAEQKYKKYLEDEAEKKYAKEERYAFCTLHERAEDFIDNALEPAAKYSSGTKVRYKSSYNKHIKGTWIDKMPASKIKPSDIQKFYNGLDVSASTLKQVNRFMSLFYKWMVRNEYATDVISAVELPKKRDSKKSETIVIWDDKSWKKLTSSKFDFRHDFLIKLMSYSGMRIGECLGLKYSDIDGDTIHVRRQYSMHEIKPPKYNSKRDIPMHKKLRASFKRHKAWHEAEMKKNHYRTEYVFTTSSGRLIDVTNLHKAFNRFYESIGIERQTFHVYRHTFCTKLCEAGVPLEVAAKLLGHKNLEVTAAHYTLVRQDTKKDAIAKLK